MLNSSGVSLIHAAKVLLRPLVRILLRNGIDYGTFAELVRKVYVDAAMDHLSEGGQKTTVSAVAAVTGLTRKEARRLKELDMPESAQTHQRYNRAIRVISGWMNDPNYLNDAKAPASLSLDQGEYCFAQLVKHYSGDIPAQAMLAVLEASGTVRVEEGKVRLLSHAYVPQSSPEEKLDILGADVAELIATIGHNLDAPADALRFQRKVSNRLVPEQAVDAFQRLSADKAQRLLEELNRWLGDHEVDEAEEKGGDEAEQPLNYVSMGVYFYHKQVEPTTEQDG